MARCAWVRIAAVTIALAGCKTVAPIGPVTATSYEVGHFAGSSLGEDAHIYDARREGIGQVYAPRLGPEAELIVRSRPRRDAPVVAYLDLGSSDAEGSGMSLKASEPGLREEVTRVSHDDYGLVVDVIRNGWARTIYGYRLTGEVRSGWVQLVPGQVEFVSYDDQLAHHESYFKDPPRVELFEKPNGRRVEFPLESKAGEGPNYRLTVQSLERDWVQVALEVPDTGCGGDPDAKVERSATVWVRRYDSKGRYQIHYAAAGC